MKSGAIFMPKIMKIAPIVIHMNSTKDTVKKYGLVVCYHGNIFKYEIIDGTVFDPHMVDAILDRIQNIIYNPKRIDRKTLDKNMNFLEKPGVRLEVFLKNI